MQAFVVTLCPAMMNKQTDAPLGPESKTDPTGRLSKLSTWLPGAIFVAVLTIGLILILTLSIPSGPTPLRVGDVAKQNIRSPQRVSYVSQIKTRQAKEAAAAARLFAQVEAAASGTSCSSENDSTGDHWVVLMC